MANAGGAAGLICPACRVNLVMSERAGVEIDYCPQCRGVWLDRGELDKILERSATEMPSAPSSRQQPHSDSRDDRGLQHHSDEYKVPKHYKHRRKSFLDDIFDFD
jgi:Zn-finger nucleic acid-binding protein